MKMFELLPRPLGSIFRRLTHFTCNSRSCSGPTAIGCALAAGSRFMVFFRVVIPLVVKSKGLDR